jgi:hypothetical protein
MKSLWGAARGMALAATIALGVAAPASAADFVLFNAFDGDPVGSGGSNYSFGYTSAGTFGGTLTPFDRNCSGDPNIACNGSNAVIEVSVSKALVNDGSYDPSGTAFYNAGELNFHPGLSGENSGFQFSTAAGGVFSYSIGLSSNDDAGRGSIDYRLFRGTTLLNSGILTGGSTNLLGNVTLAGGEAVSLLIGANGDYRFDSTGVSATFSSPDLVAAVPEPATWAMMIGGFGLSAERCAGRASGSMAR